LSRRAKLVPRVVPRAWEEARAPKHRVSLSVAERDELTSLLRKGKAAARQWAPARLLLQVDESGSGPGGTDEQTACALHLSTRPLERGRERLVEQGWAAALWPQPSTRRYERAFDGAQAAPLLALAGRPSPAGPARWTLRLLAEQAVEWQMVDTVSHESGPPARQKTNASPLGGRGGAFRRSHPLSLSITGKTGWQSKSGHREIGQSRNAVEATAVLGKETGTTPIHRTVPENLPCLLRLSSRSPGKNKPIC
jgi:hypothetical protein